MHRFAAMIVLLLAFAALPFAVHAQEEPDSMDPVSDGLPEGAADAGRVNSEFGLGIAAEAREDGRAFGERRSAAARAGEDLGRGRVDEARGGGNPVE